MTRAVGIGSNEKCLQRAMNVAIAFTLFKKRGVKVPDHLALLLEQVSPLAGVTGPPSRGSAGSAAPASPEPVPVKAMPPPPPAAVAGPAMSLVSAPVAIELHSLRQRVANLEDIVGQLYRYRSKADAVIEKLYEKLHKAEEKPLEDRPTRSSSEERDGDGHGTPFASLKGAAQALAEAFGASKEEAEEETMKMMKEEPDFEEEPELPAPPVPEAKPELPETLEEDDEEELVVKAELSDDGSVQSLEVDDIYFSQDSCSDYLQDGQSMEEVVNQIVNGDINVDETDWLILDVFKMKSPQTKKLKLYSADNRRLKILKLAQERLREADLPGLRARARVRYMNADCRKFLMHFSTKNDGKTIEVKPKRQRMA